ncbi:hypothetical protein Poli38472_009655 [Pythium oligandrum]|uniref:Uncharacterized protein n=1 Tax=Pythium oligandrum TaxID=41045 RepID=A0A8K1FJU1_PYTOL|nr:hypothetical protein Poli38472_009655 [Pythium oligandrum]|eukprot:TMW62162.1 hypothetical protein Poli38472_009655 [Pythium oligandrum]
MDEQEWSRSTRRHASQRSVAVTGPTNPSLSVRKGSAGATVSTAASRSREASGRTLVPPSRWKELRQSVRVKATMETDDRRVPNAKIADLCEEDREKVSKLIRRIVEVGALHEASEAEFQRHKTLLESEVQELREHVKRDAQEMEEMSDKLKAALGKLREYQERVLVLEESNDVEAKHRMDSDQTMDLLKMEVEKLRKLVRKQKEEMEVREAEQHKKHREEMDRMADALKEAQEQLLTERKERLQEKQRELEERLQRSAPPPPPATPSYQAFQSPPGAMPSFIQTPVRPNERSLQLDMSSLLNTSVELPEKIKEIMEEWKKHMEDALTGSAVAKTPNNAPRAVSKACQTERGREEEDDWSSEEEGMREQPEDESDSAMEVQDVAVQTPVNAGMNRGRKRSNVSSIPRVRRRAFDRMLVLESDSEADLTPAAPAVSAFQSARAPPRRSRSAYIATPTNEAVRVSRTLAAEFTPSVLYEDEEATFDEEVQNTIEMLGGIQEKPRASRSLQGLMATPPSQPNRLSLYEASLLDVVDAIEEQGPNARQTRDIDPLKSGVGMGASRQDSSTERMDRLIEGLRAREQKLARITSQKRANGPHRGEDSLMNDIAIFQDVQDVYEQDRFNARPQRSSESFLDTSIDHKGPPLSTRDLSVREAIEKDMEELLREEAFQNILR